MREILFRGKQADNGEWAFGYLFDDGLIDRKRTFVGGLVVTDAKDTTSDRYEIGIVFYEVDPATIGQYTGLTDKNGVKIFEGDIITCSQYLGGNFVDYHIEKGYVEMKFGAFGLHRKQGYYRPFKDWLEDYEFEVTGNIHDNPELLSKEETQC